MTDKSLYIWQIEGEPGHILSMEKADTGEITILISDSLEIAESQYSLARTIAQSEGRTVTLHKLIYSEDLMKADPYDA